MAEDTRKLFVAGLPDSINEDALRSLFEAVGGNVVEVSLPKDRATGRPRGFGFVTLATSDEANTVRASLDGSFQGGKSISVRPFQAEPPRAGSAGPNMGPSAGPRSSGGPSSAGPGAPDRTLYVGNLPYDCSVEEVEKLIADAGGGPTARVHLPMDPEGRKRGFGFVTMPSADAAKAAIDVLREANVRGRRLVVNLAHPKGDRPARDERAPSGGFGGGFSGGGGGGGGGGSNFGPPAAPRKTFDDRRRRGGGHDDGPPGGAPGGAAGRRGGGGGKNWDKGHGDDWDD